MEYNIQFWKSCSMEALSILSQLVRIMMVHQGQQTVENYWSSNAQEYGKQEWLYKGSGKAKNYLTDQTSSIAPTLLDSLQFAAYC